MEHCAVHQNVKLKIKTFVHAPLKNAVTQNPAKYHLIIKSTDSVVSPVSNPESSVRLPTYSVPQCLHLSKWCLYQFLKAAVTSYHKVCDLKFGDLKQQKFILSQFCRLEVQDQAVSRAIPTLKALGKGCQTHFHRGPHQPHSCLQRAECNFRTV